jgi:hypothetical protein
LRHGCGRLARVYERDGIRSERAAAAGRPSAPDYQRSDSDGDRVTRLLVAPIAALALLLPAGAGGLPGDTYSASSSPPVVQASSTNTYTVVIASDSGSAGLAARARVGIPGEFTLTGAPVTAVTTAPTTTRFPPWRSTAPPWTKGTLEPATRPSR